MEGGTLVGRDEEGGDEVEGKGDFVVDQLICMWIT
jgi:hypothetical protein